MVRLALQPFDPWQAVAERQRRLRPGSFGATALFVGTMRDFNLGDGVSGMFLEHYPGMTERELERIAGEARRRWELLDLLVIHRVGEISPGEPIVLIAVWSAHREEAFAACCFLIEELKKRAPFWKRETLKGGGKRWVAPPQLARRE